MPRPRLIALTALLLAAASCGKDDSRVRLQESQFGGVSAEVQPTVISGDSPAPAWRVVSANFGRPFRVRVLSESLAVVLDRADPFMHLVDVKRGEYLYPLVPPLEENGGPLNVYRLAPSPSDALEFIGYDLIGGTLTTFRVGGADQPLTVLRSVRLSAVETIDAPIWHRDGSVTVEPLRENSLRAQVAADGSLASHSGVSLADGAFSWVPSAVWRRAMGGQTCPRPDRTRIARTFQYMGQLMVLDSLGAAIRGTRDDRFFPPQFEVRDETGEVVFAPNGNSSRLAYLSCGATRDRVFALFSGRRPRFTSRNTEVGAAQIHVYDWNAAMTGGFRLQRDALAMDVTPDGRTIVALEGGYVEPAVAGYAVPRKYR
jgi:hypothetical protein